MSRRNRERFSSQEEYREWYRNYRKKNREKLRIYNREYERKRRKETNFDNYYKNPAKPKAHALLNSAIKHGEIQRGVCEMCKEVKTEGHHDNYFKPLEVRWLCKTHHRAVHPRKYAGG